MRVHIYKPAKSAAQSGRAKTHQWLIEPELLSSRAPEPLMGWAHADDTMTELLRRLRFTSVEEALSFAHRKGWEAVVTEPTERRITPRNYLDNFRTLRPQDEERKARG